MFSLQALLSLPQIYMYSIETVELNQQPWRERERETERQTDRQTDRQTERQRERERERERAREREQEREMNCIAETPGGVPGQAMWIQKAPHLTVGPTA